MSKYLFNQSPRGDTIVNLPLSKLYELVLDRATTIADTTDKGLSIDPVAVAQNFCVTVEKAMGIYPNTGEPSDGD